MQTVRYMQRLWDQRKYPRLLAELLDPRIERLAAAELSERPASAAAALALIRMDELNQSHAPLASMLIRALIASQDPDGGWGDVATTALCLRALSLTRGRGESIARGMQYLAALQQPGGLWPKIPIRRMPADALVSAFTLLQLADNELFRASINLDAATQWFDATSSIDSAARTLWDHARLRIPAHEPMVALS